MPVKLLTGILATLAISSPARAAALRLLPTKPITEYSQEMWRSQEGLPQNSVMAICQTRDGYLWLGTEEGLARFDGWRITVFDRKWVDAGNRHEAYYTNIPPGHYQFQAIASNNDGVWNSSGAVFAFNLKPRFYQTALFYVLLGLILTILVLAGHRLRVRRLKAGQVELVSIVAQRTEELRRDIAERRRAEAALKHSEERYRELFENANDAIYVHDLRGNLVSVNRAAEALTGRSREELLDMNISHFFSARDAEVVRLAVERSLRGGERGAYEVTIVTKDGRATPLEVSVSVVYENGNPAAIQGILRDIAERKRTADALERAKSAAEAAARAKSEFLANMSHEIRTPLNGVIGMTDLVLGTELSPEQRESLTIVKSSADSLLTVINDVLDFSKIEAGKLDLECVPFDPRVTVKEAVKSLVLRAHAKGLELNYDIRSDVPQTLEGDRGRLRQILVNLLANAVKFTDRGDVVVRVESNRDGPGFATLRFSVTDSGIGIPIEKQKAIFAPFAQANRSTARQYGGTGLGLSITARLVEMMGGKIGLVSSPSAGSTFHFTARFGKPSAREQLSQPSARSLGGLRVLVADGNEITRQILGEKLAAWSVAAVLVADATGASAALKQACDDGRPFSFALIEAGILRSCHLSAFRQCSIDANVAPIKIIGLSSMNPRGYGDECRRLGATASLTKPVGEDELLEVLLKAQASADAPCPSSPPVIPPHADCARSERFKILLAEDNPVNQRLALRLIEKRGHSVVVAENGREALAALEKQDFDLVLMDIQMPVMDGFEATAAIRTAETPGGPHLPIIAMTAHAMKGDRERCLAAGMDGYIPKPIKADELFETIEACVARNPIPKTDPLTQHVDRA